MYDQDSCCHFNEFCYFYKSSFEIGMNLKPFSLLPILSHLMAKKNRFITWANIMLQWCHNQVNVTWFTPPTCMAGIHDASQPLLQLFFYYLFLIYMPFWMYKVMWSINKLSNLIGYYKIQVINITMPGMLAPFTGLFFAVGRDNLETRLKVFLHDHEDYVIIMWLSCDLFPYTLN